MKKKKIFLVFLGVLMCFNSIAYADTNCNNIYTYNKGSSKVLDNSIMNSFNPGTNIATGEYIVISNESVSDNEYENTGTFTINNSKYSLSKNIPIESYRINPVIKPHFNEGIDQKSINKNKSFQSVSYSLGDTRNFKVSNFTDDGEEVYTVNAKLLYSQGKCNVWSADSNFTSAHAQAMGIEFNNKIHNLVTDNFSETTDVDNNGKIDLLCYDIIDGFEGYGGYIGGYFYGGDLFNPYYVSDSNYGEILYIDTYPAMSVTGSFNPESAYSTIVHEFQHLANFSYSVFVEYGYNMPVWIDEGMAMAAEHMYEGKALTSRINYYNQSTSISRGHSVTYWDNYGDVLSNYSLSYLFFQYLKNQCGIGDTIFKEILKEGSNSNSDVEAVIKKYIGSDVSLNSFLTDFRMALVRKDIKGRYGFKGDSEFNNINLNLYKSDSSTSIRGAGAITINSNSAKYVEIPSDKGANIKYVGNYDVLAKEDINKDNEIDITDISKLALFYNMSTTEENWYYDQNSDFYIDLFDLIKVSKQL